MAAVQKNVKIISPLLASGETNTSIKKLIKRLQDRIYPKIDMFIKDAKIVLSEQFHMDLTGKDFILSKVEAIFEKEKDSIEPQIRGWIDDMIKDIHYLNEMQKLEDPEYAKNNDVSFHIVPISGLIIGLFVRLENECKTVCELWEEDDDGPIRTEEMNDSPVLDITIDYEDEDDQESSPEKEETKETTSDTTVNSLLLLHNAIKNCDEKKISEILEKSPNQINLQDEDGFSPLHIVAATHTIQHLHFFELFLSHDAIDVNVKTKQGNSILYYLVRVPIKDNEDNQLLLRTCKKLILLSCDVNSKNNVGETCLHSACVLDNPEVVKLLLDSGAMVSETNCEGESCLFTAVRASNKNVVKVLLENGASCDTSSVCGKSPLDIARQKRDASLIELLTGKISFEMFALYLYILTLFLEKIQDSSLEPRSISLESLDLQSNPTQLSDEVQRASRGKTLNHTLGRLSGFRKSSHDIEPWNMKPTGRTSTISTRISLGSNRDQNTTKQ